MSGPVRQDGADELGLAEVAWQLRSTLTGAGDIPIHDDEAVLSNIRRRSTKRRRTKRVLSTSVAAFALSLSTLAVVKGGQVAIDHNLARRDESPAVTPGNSGSGEEEDSSKPGPTTNGTTAPKGKGTPNECRPDPHNGAVACQPNHARPEDSTVPGVGPNGDPDTTTPDGAKAVPGPSTTVAPTTTMAPPQPTTTKRGIVRCEEIFPTSPPDVADCFQEALASGTEARGYLNIPDPATGSTVRVGVTVGAPGVPVSYDAFDPATQRNKFVQCSGLRYTGSGPNWYEFSGCTPPINPVVQSNLS